MIRLMMCLSLVRMVRLVSMVSLMGLVGLIDLIVEIDECVCRSGVETRQILRSQKFLFIYRSTDAPFLPQLDGLKRKRREREKTMRR